MIVVFERRRRGARSAGWILTGGSHKSRFCLSRVCLEIELEMNRQNEGERNAVFGELERTTKIISQPRNTSLSRELVR